MASRGGTGRSVSRLDLLAQRRNDGFIRSDAAPGDEWAGLVALFQWRPLRLGSPAPPAVSPVDRRRHAHRWVRDRRWGGFGVPGDRDGGGRRRPAGLRRLSNRAGTG